MAMKPEDARAEAILEARINQVLETLWEIFGQVSIAVMFGAIARWFGMVMFNTCPTPADRRQAVKNFAEQIEATITKLEKGTQA